MILNTTALDVVGLTGSTGSSGYRQGSSFVGKSTIAKRTGRIVVSLADEIRRAHYGNEIYGDPIQRSFIDKPVEPAEIKQCLIELGERCNQTESYGWVLLAVCKMLYHGGRQYIVDDVRRIQEAMLISTLGGEIVEIARVDGNTRHYGSDGKIVSVYDVRLINDGSESFLNTAANVINCMPTSTSEYPSLDGQRAVIRTLLQCLSDQSRHKVESECPSIECLFDDACETQNDGLPHYQTILNKIVETLREHADNIAQQIKAEVLAV